MSEFVNYEAIRIKAQRTILEDGLLDIVMGIYMVLSGFFLSNRVMILNYIWLPVGLALIDVLRKKYIIPQTGYAKLKIPSKEILTVFVISLIGMLLIGLLVGITAPDLKSLKVGRNSMISYTLAALTIIFFCAMAYRFNLPRWYLYGFLFGVTFILYHFLGEPLVVSGLGIIVTAIGVTIFVSYLRKYPATGDEIFQK